jgi:hypothetical protein
MGSHRPLTGVRHDPGMHVRRALIGSSLTTAVTVVVLTAMPDRPADIAAAVALLIALVVLARSAIRLAGRPATRQDSARPTQD